MIKLETGKKRTSKLFPVRQYTEGKDIHNRLCKTKVFSVLLQLYYSTLNEIHTCYSAQQAMIIQRIKVVYHNEGYRPVLLKMTVAFSNSSFVHLNRKFTFMSPFLYLFTTTYIIKSTKTFLIPISILLLIFTVSISEKYTLKE